MLNWELEGGLKIYFQSVLFAKVLFEQMIDSMVLQFFDRKIMQLLYPMLYKIYPAII